ncbi:hypothetical protein MTO96_042449 [Rhipicephalus appendiculatus]
MATSADRTAASGDRSVVTTPVGRLAEFSPDTGSIEVYIERFEVFASADNINELKKAQVFLTVLVTERYRFHRRDQGQSETIEEFVVELKKLAATCEFGSFLEESLRDRLISGLRSEDIRCRLLSLPNKEARWERVLNIATAMETAKNDTKEILPAPADVNWQNKPPPKGSQRAKAKQRPQMGLPPGNLGSRGKKDFLARDKENVSVSCHAMHSTFPHIGLRDHRTLRASVKDASFDLKTEHRVI